MIIPIYFADTAMYGALGFFKAEDHLKSTSTRIGQLLY